MSDQGALFSPPAEDAKWWQVVLRCVDCRKPTCRPFQSERPCAWCHGELRPVDVA
jgi:hypothetical protein